MKNGKYVVYYRVSTQKQGKSGLGIEAQQEAVRVYLNGGNWKLVGTFTEQESGKRNDRPELDKALTACRLHRATLIVAKLDRLARNTKFLLTAVENSAENGVVFCDLPTIPEGPQGKFMVTQMASFAELEGGLISLRTKAALAAAKARGTVLGCRNDKIAAYAKQGATASLEARRRKASKRNADVLVDIERIRQEGATTLRAIADKLNEAGIETARGGEWSAVQVQRVLNA